MKPMFESRMSRALLSLGAAVGVVSIGVWVLDVQVHLPDWMIRVALIKLALLASGGLLAAGALMGRHAKGRPSVPPAPHMDRLGEGPAEPLEPSRGSVAGDAIERRERDTAF